MSEDDTPMYAVTFHFKEPPTAQQIAQLIADSGMTVKAYQSNVPDLDLSPILPHAERIYDAH